MNRVAKWTLFLTPFLAVPLLTVCIMLVESAVHVAPGFRRTPQQDTINAVALQANARWSDVEILREGDTRLKAWWLQPQQGATRAVIALHGVADTRAGARGHARYLLPAGYAVLLPDSRAHGVSGGTIVTYGVEERQDVLAWAAWLRSQGIREVYGIGVSMGAAILLQSLPSANLRAAVAESPFSCFPEIAADRFTQISGIHQPWFRKAATPLIALSATYAQWRYRVDLRQACPEQALREDSGNTPVLLIHGVNDGNIPIAHSRALHQQFPGKTTLWEVPEANHVEALGRAYDEYARRVLAFFAAASTNPAATDAQTRSPSVSVADTPPAGSPNPSFP